MGLDMPLLPVDMWITLKEMLSFPLLYVKVELGR